MFKKVSMLGLSLLLIFYPSASLAAESDNQQNPNETSITTEENAEVTTEASTQVDNNVTEEVSASVEDDDVTDSAEEPTVEPVEVTEESDVEVEEEAGETTETVNTNNNEEQTIETDEPSENDEETNTTIEDEIIESDIEAEGKETTISDGEEEIVDEELEIIDEENTEQQQLDEELDLTNIYGAINQRSGTSLQYDFNKGYYTLELQAGLNNMSGSQVLNQKWIAFALPNGVYLADEDVPAGVVQLPVNGKNGIAIKIPDVKEFPDSKYVYPTIPLVGEPDDNDPVLNLYLYNVNVDELTYEDLGQIEGQRDIDFSIMEGTPELDIEGSLSGKAIFDDEKGHYVLDLTVETTNNTEFDISNLYGGFTLPEGVAVINTEDTPDNIEILNLGDGLQTVAVKLPELASGENGESSIQIPLLGQTTENITASTITAYAIDEYYQEVGQFAGSINIDLSEMVDTWKFSAESQIVRDFPGLEENEFGLRFGFNTQNLTLNSIDRVKVEFLVPNNITIHEPDSYNSGDIPDSLKDFINGDTLNSGNLDLTWDGNKATINLDTVEGVNFYQGYFEAFGESNTSLDELEGLEVLVTLFQNGEEIVQELYVPFEIVAYDGDIPEEDDNEKPENPEQDPEEGDNPSNEDDETPSNDDEQQSDDNNNADDNEQPENDNTDNNNQTENQPSNDNDNDNDHSNKDGETTNNHTEGAELPDTATNMYSMLLFGTILTIAGIALFVVRKRKLTN
ncbi:LPXTG cell wall anchor domain-containing protein [Oceanobacillus bengalensis]|uniref:LPXTG cell wall anchor domain-containing protein n=1 Tax=Oceanobacillus bengalensis TaxID=1435466 RepID=A0A494Z032_9BACI|nr:LPXTG cell wall anchor domain-containing protein [Oceanobacillus bengalensis]RKQ15803.1 LPXTG cell wall anchor domain-containing protein [Oceanobacillus bengalensis]